MPPEFFTALLNGASKNQAVGAGKINVLKNAARLGRGRRIEAGSNALGPNHDQLTRLDLALIHRANQIKGAGFRGEHDRVLFLAFRTRNASHGERPKAARVAGGKDSIRANHYQRERAFYAPQGIGHGLRQGVLFGEGDEMNDNFRIAVGLKNRPLRLQTRANVWRIHQISVMCQSHPALIRLHQDGLSVQQRRVAGGRVPRVSDSECAVQLRKHFFGEDVSDQAHRLVGAQSHAIRRDDARRLLATMLQGMQAEIGELLRFRMGVDRDHAALFAEFVGG